MAIAVLALIAALATPAMSAAPRTGQSPDCRRYCMSVEPREGPEGTVFRFRGRHWRPERRVTATFGVYCRPGQACIAIAYVVRLRTDATGKFAFRLRGGPARPGDDEKGIRSGSPPTFTQRARDGGIVTRRPRYRVILPG
jgi:hypothetical protein